MSKNKEETTAPAPAEEQKPVEGEGAETNGAEAPAPEAPAPAENATKEPEAHKEAPKEEAKPVDVKRTWRAKMNCQMPTRDFLKNETVELFDSEVTPRHRALFECLSPEQAEPKKADPDLSVMVARLKAAKIPMKKNITDKEVRELFDKFLGSGATAGQISGDAK